MGIKLTSSEWKTNVRKSKSIRDQARKEFFSHYSRPVQTDFRKSDFSLELGLENIVKNLGVTMDNRIGDTDLAEAVNFAMWQMGGIGLSQPSLGIKPAPKAIPTGRTSLEFMARFFNTEHYTSFSASTTKQRYK